MSEILRSHCLWRGRVRGDSNDRLLTSEVQSTQVLSRLVDRLNMAEDTNGHSVWTLGTSMAQPQSCEDDITVPLAAGWIWVIVKKVSGILDCISKTNNNNKTFLTREIRGLLTLARGSSHLAYGFVLGMCFHLANFSYLRALFNCHFTL